MEGLLFIVLLFLAVPLGCYALLIAESNNEK